MLTKLTLWTMAAIGALDTAHGQAYYHQQEPNDYDGFRADMQYAHMLEEELAATEYHLMQLEQQYENLYYAGQVSNPEKLIKYEFIASFRMWVADNCDGQPAFAAYGNVYNDSGRANIANGAD